MRKVLFAAALVSSVAVSTAGATTLPAGFTETLVGNGITAPTAMEIAPDGRLFVLEQPGRARIIKNGLLLTTPFVTLTVNASLERGLLGIAFDPAFSTNHFVYLYYTATTPAIHNRVSRFTANGDLAVAGSEMVLLDLPNLSTAENHNGGAIHFGPDGKLYIAVGENADPSLAPLLTSAMGKMLRINSDGTIPSDNPFFSQTSGINRAIWARGLRNPFTFAFQPGTGLMYIDDVGNVTWETIDQGVAGMDYGWGPTMNDSDGTEIYRHGNGTVVIPGTPAACAIIGGTFYNPAGANFPSTYVGKYLFTDYCGNWIRTIDPATKAVATFATDLGTFGAVVDMKVAGDGTLYYLARGDNSVFSIRYTANPTATATATATVTPTFTPTATATATVRPRASNTATASMTATVRPRVTNTATATTATATRTATATATPTSGGGSTNFTAAFWTQGDDPCTHNGPAGSGQPWVSNGACTSCAPAWSASTTYTGGTQASRACGGGSTPTSTATATATSTARATATATTGTATATVRARATATATATPTTGGGICAGVAAFQTCTTYASGAKVVFNNALYHAIVAIPATRDCPPNSPFNPGNDNWWVNDGACN